MKLKSLAVLLFVLFPAAGFSQWSPSPANTTEDISRTGNVGIGSAPAHRLHVFGSTLPQFVVEGPSEARLQLKINGTSRFLLNHDNSDGYIGTQQGGGSLFFMTEGISRMYMNALGHLVIGNATESLATKLSVHGDVYVRGNISAKYQDLAEWVPAASDLEPGTVVVLDAQVRNQVTASTRPYDTTVAGVVSAQPGIILGEGGDSKEQIATTGRVKVRVDATDGPIRIGDLLVTGEKTGTAMRSRAVEVGGVAMHRPGTVIGKALEPLAAGTGEILVLLSLQ